MPEKTPIKVDDVIQTWRDKGDSEYGGEPVTQLQHALQSALLAEKELATPELITAALLHDFGHLVHDLPDDAPDKGIDDRHEHVGKNFLNKLFPQSVTEPIRLHVEAKRYLCHKDKDYLAKLSSPSLTSLELQGGPMSETEATEFESHPFWQEAVRLRKWDDEAKIPDMELPDIEYFRQHLESAASSGNR